MEDTFQQVLIPLQQAIIFFHGYEILAVRLPNNRIAAALSSLCAMLGIRPHGQAGRIRRRKDLAQHLLLALVETSGGPQRMDVLVAEAIPFWVLGVQVEQLAPEKRPMILALKEEAVEVLYRHFFHIDQAPPPPPEQPTTSPDSPRALLQQGFHLIGKAVQMLEEKQQATDEHLAALESHQEVFEERQQAIGEYIVETRERVKALEQRRDDAPGEMAESEAPSGNQLLSPQHLGQVYVLARQERQRSGESVSALLGMLAQEFGVPDISDLPDSAWDDVLGWFWERQRRG